MIFCLKINIKVFYKLVTSLLLLLLVIPFIVMGMVSPAQITKVTSLQNLCNISRDGRDEVDFLCNEHHNFL